MPAHSRSKNGVASLAYVAGIRVLQPRQIKDVDGREKTGAEENRSPLSTPHHPRAAGLHRVVIPLQSKRLLAEHVGLETPPGLELEIIERAAVSAKPMRYAGRKINQRAGFDFLAGIADLDHAAALENDVGVGGPAGIGGGADMPMIR